MAVDQATLKFEVISVRKGEGGKILHIGKPGEDEPLFERGCAVRLVRYQRVEMRPIINILCWVKINANPEY
jgi:hypothetical protein